MAFADSATLLDRSCMGRSCDASLARMHLVSIVSILLRCLLAVFTAASRVSARRLRVAFDAHHGVPLL